MKLEEITKNSWSESISITQADKGKFSETMKLGYQNEIEKLTSLESTIKQITVYDAKFITRPQSLELNVNVMVGGGLKKSDEKIKIGGRDRVVYYGKWRVKYVKHKGEFVKVSQLNKMRA